MQKNNIRHYVSEWLSKDQLLFFFLCVCYPGDKGTTENVLLYLTQDLRSFSVAPQPVVTQGVPGRMLVKELGRHIGEIRGVISTALDSFSSVISL